MILAKNPRSDPEFMIDIGQNGDRLKINPIFGDVPDGWEISGILGHFWYHWDVSGILGIIWYLSPCHQF